MVMGGQMDAAARRRLWWWLEWRLRPPVGFVWPMRLLNPAQMAAWRSLCRWPTDVAARRN